MIRFYYTIEELYDSEAVSGFNRLFKDWLGTYTDDSDTKALWKDVEDKYLEDGILYIDIDTFKPIAKPSKYDILNDTELKKQVVKQLRKIRAYVDDSKFRYSKLIKLYNDNANNLMNQLTATTQFNDTPQTTNTGLDDDAYATTYTVNKTDSGTVLQRLSEVRALWNSVISEWCSEFSRKFVYYY